MQKVKVPLRISIIGGGTDNLDYYKAHSGRTISCAIDKYVTLRRSHSYVLRINGVHPSSNPLFKRICNRLGIIRGNFQLQTDAQHGMGLGASSALTVAFVRLCLPDLHLSQTAELAYHIEHPITGCGRQDAYTAVYGGMCDIHYGKTGKVQVCQMDVTKLKHFNFMLFSVGLPRVSSEYYKRWDTSKLIPYRELTDSAYQAINGMDTASLADCINRAMAIKRTACEDVVGDEVSDVLSIGMNNGAIAGRLLGAGGSGHVIFMVEDGERDRLAKSLHFIAKEVSFEFVGGAV